VERRPSTQPHFEQKFQFFPNNPQRLILLSTILSLPPDPWPSYSPLNMETRTTFQALSPVSTQCRSRRFLPPADLHLSRALIFFWVIPTPNSLSSPVRFFLFFYARSCLLLLLLPSRLLQVAAHNYILLVLSFRTLDPHPQGEDFKQFYYFHLPPCSATHPNRKLCFRGSFAIIPPQPPLSALRPILPLFLPPSHCLFFVFPPYHLDFISVSLLLEIFSCPREIGIGVPCEDPPFQRPNCRFPLSNPLVPIGFSLSTTPSFFC